MTHAQADVDPGARKNPRPSGGGEGERCTCHLPGSTYPRPEGGVDPDCPEHNPA